METKPTMIPPRGLEPVSPRNKIAATATRDLLEMTKLGLLRRTGERKHTRYHPTIPPQPVRRITLGDNGQITISRE